VKFYSLVLFLSFSGYRETQTTFMPASEFNFRSKVQPTELCRSSDVFFREAYLFPHDT